MLREKFKDMGLGERTWFLVEHKKPRARGEGNGTHYHVVYAEVCPVTAKVLPSSFTKVNNEYWARRWEIKFGHPLTKGRHNKAVYNRLIKEELFEEAEMLMSAGLLEGNPAREGYSSGQQRKTQKLSISMPKLEAEVRQQWISDDPKPINLDRFGLKVERGSKRNVWIVTKDGTYLCALHRLLRVKKAEVERRQTATAMVAAQDLNFNLKGDNNMSKNTVTEQNDPQKDLKKGLALGVIWAIFSAKGTSPLVKLSDLIIYFIFFLISIFTLFLGRGVIAPTFKSLGPWKEDTLQERQIASLYKRINHLKERLDQLSSFEKQLKQHFAQKFQHFAESQLHQWEQEKREFFSNFEGLIQQECDKWATVREETTFNMEAELREIANSHDANRLVRLESDMSEIKELLISMHGGEGSSQEDTDDLSWFDRQMKGPVPNLKRPSAKDSDERQPGYNPPRM